MWEVILRTVEFASEVQSFKVENEKQKVKYKCTPPHSPISLSQKSSLSSCSQPENTLHSSLDPLGLHPSSPEPAILSDQQELAANVNI